MKFLRPALIAICGQLVIASPLAIAQNKDTQSGQEPSSTQQGTQSGQQSPGTTTRYSDPSHKSTQDQGTLMQKREQGMSPQGGASSGNATGKMSQ